MQAFILRIAPGGNDRISMALASDQLIIGWSRTPSLLDPSLTWTKFRQLIREKHYLADTNLRRAGAAAGHMWRFIRDMQVGDLVVVPSGNKFYVAEVTGEAAYLPEMLSTDTCYRRAARWLNDKKAIPRSYAKAALISRMKIQGTSASASDLVAEIEDCLKRAATGAKPSFKEELRARLVKETVAELRSGHMDSFAFEGLIKDLLLSMGAKKADVVARRLDKGADVLADFRVAEVILFKLAVQAKHWDASSPVGPSVVEQLIKGIEASAADLGMVVTSGTISEEAEACAKAYTDETGIKIELVDGEQFAVMLIEQGISLS